MIRTFSFVILLLSSISSFAQTDSSAYQTQRLKVNALLMERSAKFGQYDESLDSKTGIFGLQTKGDIKKSNEILRQIVLNDNNVFKELKILMDYKDVIVKQAQNKANTTSGRIENYRLSIKKIQDQNQLLNKEAKKLEKQRNYALYFGILMILVLTGVIFLKKNKGHK